MRVLLTGVLLEWMRQKCKNGRLVFNGRSKGFQRRGPCATADYTASLLSFLSPTSTEIAGYAAPRCWHPFSQHVPSSSLFKKHFLYDLKSLGRLYFSFLYNLILSDTEHVQVSLFFFNLIIPTFLITRRFSHTICYLGISVSPPPVIPGNGSGVRSAGSDECEAALSAFLWAPNTFPCLSLSFMSAAPPIPADFPSPPWAPALCQD